MKTENFTVMRQTGTSGSDLDASLRVCTKWVNMKLKQAGDEPVEDLVEAFKSGVVLATVLEQLEPGTRVRVKKNARYPALWLDNLNICFKVIDKLKIPHSGIVAKDFMDGRTKLIVSFIWRLITTYDLPRSSKMILKWFNKRIKKFGYEIDIMDPCPGCTVGVVFNALVESQREGSFDVPALNGADPAKTAENAFDFLEREYEVAKLLEGDDVAACAIDDVSLVLYLKKVKDAFDAETFDVEPESISYSGEVFIFAPGEAMELSCTILPAEAENLEFECEPDLPDGMELNEETGTISGTPTAAGCCEPTDFHIIAMNTSGEVSTMINIMVREVEPTGIAFESESCKFVVGEGAEHMTVPHVEPVDANVKFSIEPRLHAGLVFDEQTGGIGGTAETYDGITDPLTIVHAVTASNSGGAVSASMTVDVVHPAPEELTCSSPVLGEVGTPVQVCIGLTCASAAPCPVEWVSTGLPEGLVINAEGLISGNVSAPGTWGSTVEARNSGGYCATEIEFRITDVPPASITYDTPVSAVAEVGITLGGGAPVVDPVTPVNFTIEPPLAAGLVFDEQTGAISGTPDASAVGKFEHKVIASNTGGSASTFLNVIVLEVPPQDLLYPNEEVENSDNSFMVKLGKQRLIRPSFTGKGTFTVEPPLPEGLKIDESDGCIDGVAEDPDLFGQSSVHTVTLANTGGSCSVEVTLSFSDAKREFLEYCDAHEDDHVQVLADCVSIPSCYDKVNTSTKALDWCTDKLVALGGQVTDLADGIKGIEFTGVSDIVMGVYGYLDTHVDGPWTNHEQLALLSEASQLEGCGTCQDKGPIVAWMNTIDVYNKLGRSLPIGLKMIVDLSGTAGSPNLECQAVEDYLQGVRPIVVADGSWLHTPTIVTASRGVIHCTVTCNASKRNRGHLRSGIAGAVEEPMGMMAVFMGHLGSIASRSEFDQNNYEKVPFDPKVFSSIDTAHGEAAENSELWLLDSFVGQPALTIHSVVTSLGAKSEYNVSNVTDYGIPASAKLQFSIRTVKGMDNGEIISAIGALAEKCLGNDCTLSVDQNVEAFDCTNEFLERHPSEFHHAAIHALREVHELPDRGVEIAKTGETIAAASVLQGKMNKYPIILPISGMADLLCEKEQIGRQNYLNGIKVAGLFMENVFGETVHEDECEM